MPDDLTLTPPEKNARSLVLIVEDVGVQVRLVQICLERADYRVIAARDGAEALRQVFEHMPDLILLDVDLPVLNGFQVLDTLRKEEATRSIPVVMLTAHAKDSALFAQWATQADTFLTKPFSPDALLETVQQVLASPREPAPSPPLL